MIEIFQKKIKNTTLTVPGSKSYTHRMLIASALSDGKSCISNPLKSEDTILTKSALQKMGIIIKEKGNSFLVHGTGGRISRCEEPINLENSGTSMRLLTSVAALGSGEYILTGSSRMGERPIQDLLDALISLGINVSSLNNNGFPPVRIKGGKIPGGKVLIDCHVSSQFLSSLLLIAPYTLNGMEIIVSKGPVSRPYIDMTLDIMERLGIAIQREGYNFFKVPGGQIYTSGSYVVEPDCSQASYFWAAAAITGKSVKVRGISRNSRQGDLNFLGILEKMGCRITHDDDGITVTGGELSAIKADMSDMPDVVPTLSVVAAFAKGTTHITNVAHLKEKESDRLGSVASELEKTGINAKATKDGLVIEGGTPHGAEIETYNDHRIAMSFAVAGLIVPGIFIKDEQCVEKSFPDFWDVFMGLY